MKTTSGHTRSLLGTQVHLLIGRLRRARLVLASSMAVSLLSSTAALYLWWSPHANHGQTVLTLGALVLVASAALVTSNWALRVIGR